MVSPREITVLTTCSSVMSFLMLIGAVVFHLMGMKDGGLLLLMALPFNFITMSVAMFGRGLKAQSERFDRLEAQVFGRPQA